MTDLQCDVAIIGAGTAGLAAERAARTAGASTIIIDPKFLGTTCATVGCMPSKLLIAAGKAAHQVRTADEFGIRASLNVDGPAVMARVRRLRDDFAAAARASIKDIPSASRLRGSARFVARGELAVGADRIKANAIVIATGATPNIPAMFDAISPQTMTNESVFEMADLPQTLAVIGAGPEGLEIAQAMARLGVKVQVFDNGHSMAGTEDIEGILPLFSHDMAIHLGADLSVRQVGDHAELQWANGSARFQKVFVAVGRSPALKGLDLHRSGLELDDHGTPVFDRSTMQCGQSAVFIVGDADHDRAILHEATDEGDIAGINAASYPDLQPKKRKLPLAITFTHPSIAIVGDLSRGANRITATGSWSDQGRARVENQAEGFVTLHAERSDKRIVGAFLCLHEAEYLAHYLALAISAGMTADAILDQPIYHPTLLEGLKGPLREICDS